MRGLRQAELHASGRWMCEVVLGVEVLPGLGRRVVRLCSAQLLRFALQPEAYTEKCSLFQGWSSPLYQTVG